MLTQYDNINDILKASGSLSGRRMSAKSVSNFLYSNPNVNWNTNTTNVNSTYELHVYSDDTWITGNHDVKRYDTDTNLIKNAFGPSINFGTQPSVIDIYNEFNKLRINSGQFRFVVNFHKNLIGNYNKQYLSIDQISEDRTELRLFFIEPTQPMFVNQLAEFIYNVANGRQTRTTVNNIPTSYKSYLLNFSRNQNFVFVNSVVYDNHLYIKLLKPLPDDFDIHLKCWVVEELKPSYIDRISILPYVKKMQQFRDLSSPNWYANSNLNTSVETNFKTWTDLLSSTKQTSEQIINAYFSGSIGTKLNIDYSDFNNFIFYSSAEERIKNFKFKLELLEYYDLQISEISNILGDVAITNSEEYQTFKDKLIGGFDSFEKYLYYESSSKFTTHDNPLINATVPNLTGSYITPVPKSNSTIPYVNISVSSSQFNTWYGGVLDSASIYDSQNFNALKYSVPEFIRLNHQSSDLDVFVNMLGHHYDILYMYINHMNNIHNREENPKLGMPNELLYSVAKQFGWTLTNGNQYQELWSYLFGSDENGTPLTGSLSVNGTSVSGQEMSYTVWRRIVNNLPLLLKSKGTKRSVQALLSCYGIPNSIITIKEYGGPRLERAPVYEKVNFDYALDLIGNTTGNVTVNYTTPINTVEMRFRTDNVVDNPLLPSTMNLYTIGSNTVTIDYTSGTYGTIQINGTSSANIEMFDGGWLNTILRTSGNKLEVVAKRSKYGKIVSAASASATASFSSTGTLTIGGTTGGSRLQGQIQELRFWSSSLSDTAFNNHVKAPAAYNGNVDAYDELVFRMPLTQKINHSLTSSLSGVQPVTSSLSASFAGWSNSEPYDSIEETYYYDGISLGAGTYDDNKIRIEDNYLITNLHVKNRGERSQFDTAPLDSNKLGIYFSPQTMINEDIIAQLGFTSLDDYIGDPGETEKKSYPKLIDKAHDYWKKYSDKNDINAYMKMFSLFDLSFFRQLEQLLPARVHAVTGLLVQPNLLERNKDSLLPTIIREDVTYQALLNNIHPNTNASYVKYDSTIDLKDVITVTVQDDDQWTGRLFTSMSRYDGTKYSYDYLLRSGSGYITGSTPYWKREGILPVITGSTVSEFRKYKKISSYIYSGGVYGSATYGTSSYSVTSVTSITGSFAEVQDYLPTGLNNCWYAGSKLISKDFNVPSTQSIDGGPVVEWRLANGNQLIYQNLNQNGSFTLLQNNAPVGINVAPGNSSTNTVTE